MISLEEYMEKANYNLSEDSFEKYAQKTIMGRTTNGKNGGYYHKAPLTMLKNGTDYVYRIIPVGGTTASSVMEFSTVRKNTFSFGIIGENSANDKVIFTPEDKTYFSKFVDAIGRTDLLFYLGNEQNEFKTVLDFNLIRKIPTGFYDNQGINDSTENKILAYHDILFVKIRGQYNNEQLEDYLKNTIQENKRKWTVLFFSKDNLQIDESQKNNTKSYLEVLEHCKVDMAVCDISSEEIESFNMTSQAEKQGDSVFVISESEIENKVIKVEVKQNSLSVETCYSYDSSDDDIVHVLQKDSIK